MRDCVREVQKRAAYGCRNSVRKSALPKAIQIRRESHVLEKKQTVHQGKGIASYSKGKSLDTLDLSRRNGEAIDLKSISLRGTNLRDANLTEAQLSGADLSSATLRDVDSYDHWYCVRFDGAHLSRAQLDFSYLANEGLSLYV